MTGDFKRLFDAPADEAHSYFLGSPDRPDAGLLELVEFPGYPARPREDAGQGLRSGFLLLSFHVGSIDETIRRLQALGMASDVRISEITRDNEPYLASVRDPDGVLIELIGVSPEARVLIPEI